MKKYCLKKIHIFTNFISVVELTKTKISRNLIIISLVYLDICHNICIQNQLKTFQEYGSTLHQVINLEHIKHEKARTMYKNYN